MFKKLLLLFLAWRAFLFIPVIAGHYFLPYRDGYAYTSLSYFIKEQNLILHFLLSPWANFDGIYYLMISGNGYTVNAGFFPLFPLVINVLSFIFNAKTFQSIQFFVGFMLSNFFSLAAIFVYFRIIRLDYGSKVAFTSIIFLLLFPTSFFFASIYSESLFLLLSLLCFYYARSGKFFISGIFGALLSATRFVGIAIFPALIYEMYKQKKVNPIHILSIFLTPIGLLAYMIFNYYKWGNFLYFIEAQGQFQNNRSVTQVVFLPQTIYRYIKILLTVSPNTYEWWIALLELLIFVISASLIYLGIRQKIRTSYLIFAILCFIIPISSGTFTGLPRYVAVLFPLFISLALVKNLFIKGIYVATCCILLFILLMLFSRGYFVA